MNPQNRIAEITKLRQYDQAADRPEMLKRLSRVKAGVANPSAGSSKVKTKLNIGEL